MPGFPYEVCSPNKYILLEWFSSGFEPTTVGLAPRLKPLSYPSWPKIYFLNTNILLFYMKIVVLATQILGNTFTIIFYHKNNFIRYRKRLVLNVPAVCLHFHLRCTTDCCMSEEDNRIGASQVKVLATGGKIQT